MALFNRGEISELLTALADRLETRGVKATLLIVGGAAISIEYGERPATRDIDAGIAPAAPVIAVAHEIAEERGLPSDWLNDKVKMFLPHDGVRETEWKEIISRKQVSIRVAPADVLLAMKLRAGRGRRDSPDIELLLDVCKVRSAEEAEEIFDRYYPNEEIAPRALALLAERYR